MDGEEKKENYQQVYTVANCLQTNKGYIQDNEELYHKLDECNFKTSDCYGYPKPCHELIKKYEFLIFPIVMVTLYSTV